MNDIHITLTGNVAAEPRQHTFTDGSRVTSLRVATRHRYYDKKAQEWADGETVYFAVRCWRTLGDNVAQSVQVGHPLVVSGKLRIREFGPDDDRRFMPEVEASSIGHDLRWGVGAFSKPERAGGPASASRENRESLDEATQDWTMSTSNGSGRTFSTEGGVTVRVIGDDTTAGMTGDDDGAVRVVGEDSAVRVIGDDGAVRVMGDSAVRVGGEDAVAQETGDDTVRVLGAEKREKAKGARAAA